MVETCPAKMFLWAYAKCTYSDRLVYPHNIVRTSAVFWHILRFPVILKANIEGSDQAFAQSDRSLRSSRKLRRHFYIARFSYQIQIKCACFMLSASQMTYKQKCMSRRYVCSRNLTPVFSVIRFKDHKTPPILIWAALLKMRCSNEPHPSFQKIFVCSCLIPKLPDFQWGVAPTALFFHRGLVPKSLHFL